MVHEPGWDQEDLERRLCQALDIASRAVQRLAAEGYQDSIEPANELRPEKVISETALLLFAASTVAERERVGVRVDNLARLLIPHARSEHMLLGLCLEPALSWDYAQAHVCLTRLGYADAAFDRLLRQSVGAQAATGRERVPYRVLEQQWLESHWDRTGSHAPRSSSEAALNSVLNRPMDLFNGSREDVYAFTHALMYVSDFNVHPRPWPRRRFEILAYAQAALARCLDEQDYDLGGEVLLAWPLTRSPWSAAAAFGFQVLARVEDAAGFLPAPTTRIKRLEELEGDERADYLLASAYHTAYVMGLLCAAGLQPGRSPPIRIPAHDAVPGHAERLVPFLDAGDAGPHWLDDFAQLSQAERDALAGLLFSIALRRRVSAREFGTVRDLLEVGHGMGLSDTPVASQAAEMLERLATFADITRLGKASKSAF